ncbi:hypothetical protein CDD79_07105 [Raoultella ornithinolytica]|uniref:hypothetical protein n=1 Tax=Raoultella ornithinolytica TaxID=54291 RepID=UPI000C28C68B|nr:hypothetical protein [Raoultella ornithinolytica]PJR10648.1 hypothetical protein CDD79_07105 [Raoultella ornithinolytica]PQH20012.1 hypothetical protein C5T95_25185 [Raoultella ornithinolytica]
MNIETVNELIQSLESAGELSIKERKYLELAKEFRICSASLDAAIKTGNVLADQNAQLAAENVGLKKFIQTECFVGHLEPETFYEGEVTRYVSADGYEPETPATDAYLAGIKADGVEEFAKHCDDSIGFVEPEDEELYTLMEEQARDFAKQLREGADK